ncbi:MAG: DoxX family membrane protein [Candidatus Paceibacterota bacterium]
MKTLTSRNTLIMEIIFLIGRILFGGYFLYSGINHFRDLKGVTAYANAKNVPAPKWAVIITGALLTLGGLGVVLGVFPELAILLLILFLLPTTILMHDFWNAEEQTKQAEQISFFKNFALIGALLMLLALATPWLLAL